ncbi:MAG: DUF393 domain-containing protein [Geminicoccaceae bacterium]|nr:MAG: DUF393 domain-containing protein [Geminicoccaceae bacterium]
MQRLTVYYNGACPICGAEIRHYRDLASKVRAPLDWVDISREPAALEAHGIDGCGAKRRLYATLDDGKLLAGVDAFAALWQRLPRYRWLARIVTVPGLETVAGWLYEGVLAPALVWFNQRRERRAAGRG